MLPFSLPAKQNSLIYLNFHGQHLKVLIEFNLFVLESLKQEDSIWFDTLLQHREFTFFNVYKTKEFDPLRFLLATF